MSYTVDLIVDPLPTSDKSAWKAIENLRTRYYDDKLEKSQALIALHAELTAKYRCLSSYADDEDDEDCPWADGPMLNNFSSEMGMLAISFSRAGEVVPFIVEKANTLGITVADGQTGKIHRPKSSPYSEKKQKPWWRFW